MAIDKMRSISDQPLFVRFDFTVWNDNERFSVFPE